MTNWSLSQILETLNDTIQQRLDGARKGFSHPGTKGDANVANKYGIGNVHFSQHMVGIISDLFT